MVAPERLTPGIIDRHWIRPTPIALPSEMSATPFSLPCGAVRSITRMATPPSSSAQATIVALPSIASIRSISRKPSTAEGRKATSDVAHEAPGFGLVR